MKLDYVPYTYRITHVPTGIHYYGVKYGKDANPSTFWITYFTSSQKIKQLISEYGKDSFIVEVRRKFSDAKSAVQWEQRVLNRLKVLRRNDWLNGSIGTTFRSSGPKSDEHKRKISEGNKGKIVSESTRELLRMAHVGKTHTAETKRKMSENRSVRCNTPEWRESQSRRAIECNSRPEVRRKISEANSGKSKPKVVCRISDRKEFNSATWNRWVAKSPHEFIIQCS